MVKSEGATSHMICTIGVTKRVPTSTFFLPSESIKPPREISLYNMRAPNG